MTKQPIKLVVLDQDNNPVVRFQNITDASEWANVPADDIFTAYELGDRLYGYKYILDAGDFEDVLAFGEDGAKERIDLAMHALQLITNLDATGMAFDIMTSTMLSAEQIFEKYLNRLKVREVYLALTKAVAQKHEIMDEEDQRKKELDRLLIEQPEQDKDGVDCVYVLTKDAKEMLEQFMEEDEIKGEIPEHDWEEGFICYKDHTRYFAVNSIVDSDFSFEQWRGERNASKSK